MKYLESPNKVLDQEACSKILSESKNILDNDKQKHLSEDLQALNHEEGELFPTLFKVIRELVISPIEKSYISKIEKELKEDDQLES